jgi:integrase
MSAARAKHGSYIFQRAGSENFYVKLRSPTGRVEKSLGTSVRREAEVIAGPLVTAHKAALLAARPHVETTWTREYAPGLHTGLNGERIFATDRELHYLDDDGHTIRTEANGVTVRRIVGAPQSAKSEFGMFDAAHGERPIVPKKNGDDDLLETYLKHRNITGYYEREARDVWALFKKLTDNKPLKDCDRDDGRKLVTHFEAQELKSATIEKKIGWLNAAVHLAIKEGRLKFNPFSSVVPERKDKQRRLPLTDDDMKMIKRNLGKLSESEQLLLRLLAGTGMRLSEALEIDGEETERGCRYVIVGKKTEQSLRRVPLPAAVLPFLPKAIKGPLFASDERDPADAASKRLNRFLDDCGIVDPRKVIHSLRHRAQDRLRAAGCPEDVRWSILGHEKETVAAGYGEGFPVTLLRKWIDKIGF